MIDLAQMSSVKRKVGKSFFHQSPLQMVLMSENQTLLVSESCLAWQLDQQMVLLVILMATTKVRGSLSRLDDRMVLERVSL